MSLLLSGRPLSDFLPWSERLPNLLTKPKDLIARSEKATGIADKTSAFPHERIFLIPVKGLTKSETAWLRPCRFCENVIFPSYAHCPFLRHLFRHGNFTSRIDRNSLAQADGKPCDRSQLLHPAAGSVGASAAL